MDETQVEEWRKLYGPIYTTEARGKEYFFRALSYSEYARIVYQDHDSVLIEDEVVQVALLYPDIEFDKIPAGVISSLARKIIDLSAFGNLDYAEEFLSTAREKSGQVHNLMKAFIIAAIPTYNELELDNMVFPQLAEKVALAEQIIAVNQAAMGLQMEQPTQLELIDPQSEIATQKEEHADPIAQRLQQSLG